MALLNSASSVVDYLKGKGFKQAAGERVPLFDQRKQIYNTLGLDKQLGEFRGSAIQNPALLQALSKAERSSGVALNPGNLQSILTIARGASAPKPQPIASPAQQVQFPPLPQQQIEPPAPVAQQQPTAIEPPPLPPAPVQQEQPSPLATPDIQAQALKLFEQPAPQDIAQKSLAQVTGSATYPLEQERVESEREAVKLKAQSDTEGLLSRLASRGLVFSPGQGARGTETQRIEADKLSELLGIDRRFATLIAGGLESSAQRIAKEAQQGKKDALEALNVLGYGVNPLTGAIQPTLQARQAQSQEQQRQLQAEQFQQQEARREAQQTQQAGQFQQTQERLEQQFQETQQRLESQFGAQQAATKKQADLAERRVEIAEGKAKTIPKTVPKGGTQLPAAKSVKTSDKANIEKQFNFIATGLTKQQFENAKTTLGNFLKTGDTNSAQQYIDKLAYQTLLADQKKDYEIYSSVKNNAANAIGQVAQFKSINASVYKNWVDTKKPYLALTRDQNWVKFLSTVEGAQAEFRRAYFGTALTGTELKSAEKIFIDPSKDDIKTIETKLNLMNSFAASKKTNILNVAKGGSSKQKGDALGIR